MRKQFKPTKVPKDKDQHDQEAQDLDLRLERQILLSSKLQREVGLCKDEVDYCTQFLSTLKEEHQRISKHYLFNRSSPFGGWDNKLKQLTLSAIESDSTPGKQGDKENKNSQLRQGDCSQKKHLEQILDDKAKKAEEDEITQLQEKLQKLYGRVGEAVMEEYMNEKILLKIKREAKKISKEKTLIHSEKEIAKYRNWVDEKNKKINNEIVAKQIQQKVIHNLQFMKLLMNKKIINNDYIYEQFQQKQTENERVINKIGLLSGQIQQIYKESRKMFKETSIQTTNDDNNKKNVKKRQEMPLNLSLVEKYLRDVQGTLSQLDEYEAEYELTEEDNILTSKLDSMLSVKK